MKHTSQKDRQEYVSVLKLAVQLPDEEKARLSRDLMSEVRRSRLERLQREVLDTDLSEDEIRAEVEYVRQTLYMERRGDEDYSGYKSVD